MAKYMFSLASMKKEVNVLSLDFNISLNCYVITYLGQNLCFDTLDDAQQELLRITRQLNQL